MQFISLSQALRKTAGLLGCTALAAGIAGAVQAAEPRTAAHAQTARKTATPTSPMATTSGAIGQLDVTTGKGTLMRLSEDATSVFVADPTIADVQVPSPRAVFVFGKKPGATTLYALGANSKPLLQRTVQVAQDLDSLRAAVAARFPKMNLQLAAGPGSLQVSGQANTPEEADAVVQMVTPFLADKQVLVDRMTIDRPLQVQLKVRITEVDRNVTQQMGINWNSIGSLAGNWATGIFSGRPLQNLTAPYTTTGPNGGIAYPYNLPTNNAYSIFGQFKAGNTDISAMIDLLNQENLLTVLAEPTLVALSGQTASFLAGGEFPIPISQLNGAISVEFKQFGVKLDFTPTVLNENRISLKVRPEVSQIDTTASVTAGGLTIPGLSVRRADTTVELGSGQSFMIGGLLQSTTSDLVSQVPGLGSIPILGKLFSSTNYQNNKTELLIIVTPYLVNPTDPKNLRSPLESLRDHRSRDIEYTVDHGSDDTNMLPSGAAPTSRARLSGDAGYIY